MIDEDFRTLLANLLPTGTVIEKGMISEERPSTRVFFQRSAADQELDLDGAAGLNETLFDVEVGALTDNTTQTMTWQLKTPSVVLTTLNGAIDNDDVSLVVTSAGNMPANGLPFIITIDSEKLLVTAIAGTTLTVTRGYKSTTPASHSSGANVTVAGLNGYRGTVGNTAMLGIFVADHADDYVPQLLDADEGFEVASFQAKVIHQ
jgi:hypothetical protein